MDVAITALDRAARAGDPEAAERLVHARSRAGLCCRLTGWSALWTRCECRRTPSAEEADLWLPPEVQRVESVPPQGLMAKIRDRWVKIGHTTGPTDRELLRVGVELAYAEAGLTVPDHWEWHGSPHSVWDSVWASVRASVPALVWDSVWDLVRASVPALVWASVWASVRASVPALVWASVRASVCLAFYEVFARCGLRAPLRLRGLSWACEATGLWWPCRDRVIVSERPDVLELDEAGRLVCAVYPDGKVVYGPR